MEVYVDVVALLNFLVDFLLLLGTNRLCGFPPAYGRSAAAALLGGLYGGLCLWTGWSFLSGLPWCCAVLLLMSMLAFGISRSALRRTVIFVLLSMALGGIAMGLGSANGWSLVIAAACVCTMCVIGFRSRPGSASLIPVELCHGDRCLRLLALQDTGNTLRDPITGTGVLVVGADVAWELIGLTKQQLASPIKTLEQTSITGLRLIPYHTVGKEGFLLALRVSKVKVGKWTGSALVAFAPYPLSKEGDYQALAGGAA